MMKGTRRFLGAFLFLMIVTTGTSKQRLFPFFSGLTNKISNSVGIDFQEFAGTIKIGVSTNEMIHQKTGWFLYYFLYCGLHIAFIMTIFHKQPRVRNIVMASFISFIILLLASSYIFMQTGDFELARVLRRLFGKTVGLPFALLALEGGKILVQDIKRHLRNDESELE